MFEKTFIIIGIILIIVPFILSKKYRILSLIQDQIKNFSDFETDKILWKEVLGFFIGPLCLTIGFIEDGISLTNDGLGILLNIISILTGLLISSLIAINSLEKNPKKIKLILIASKYIIFSIFITIVIFIISISKIFNFEIVKIFFSENFLLLLKKIRDASIFYLFILYILNIFLILKKLIQIFVINQD